MQAIRRKAPHQADQTESTETLATWVAVNASAVFGVLDLLLIVNCVNRHGSGFGFPCFATFRRLLSMFFPLCVCVCVCCVEFHFDMGALLGQTPNGQAATCCSNRVSALHQIMFRGVLPTRFRHVLRKGCPQRSATLMFIGRSDIQVMQSLTVTMFIQT